MARLRWCKPSSATASSSRSREPAGPGWPQRWSVLKESVNIEPLRMSLGDLGRALAWHGALSCDAILHTEGPVVIDVNPRLVEPANAWQSGVDLVGAMLHVAFGEPISPALRGRVGVRTHQLLLAVLGAANSTKAAEALSRSS